MIKGGQKSRLETNGPDDGRNGSKGQHLAVAQTRNIAIDDDKSKGVTTRERRERGTIRPSGRKVIGDCREVQSEYR